MLQAPSLTALFNNFAPVNGGHENSTFCVEGTYRCSLESEEVSMMTVSQHKDSKQRVGQVDWIVVLWPAANNGTQRHPFRDTQCIAHPFPKIARRRRLPNDVAIINNRMAKNGVRNYLQVNKVVY